MVSVSSLCLFLALSLPALASSKRSDYAPQKRMARHVRRSKCSSSSKSSSSGVVAANVKVNLGSIGTNVASAVGSTASDAVSSLTGTSSGSGLGRSLAWAMDDNLATLFESSPINNYYHWENDQVAGLQGKMQYKPMLWGASKLNMFLDVMKTYTDDNLPEWIIGFNEPDLSMQANMNPQQAAQMWQQYIQPYAAKGVKLAAPQLSYDHSWYQSFFDACDGCTFDAIGMHWYGDVNRPQDFQDAVTSFWSAFKKYAPEMWITEYSVTASSGGSEQQVLEFAKEATAFVEGLDYVTLIAWFGAWSKNPDGYASSNGRFVDDNNQLTDIGKWWISQGN